MPVFMLWSITMLFFFFFTLGILFLMTRGRRFVRVVCSVSFVIAIVGGFLFYSFSYISSGERFPDTVYAALRGIFTTTRMFFLNADYSALLTENIWLQILFWICHLSALIVIQATLFTLFARKLVESFRIRFGLHREVYIIKGCDKYALILGENIATCDNPHKLPVKKRLIVFLIEEDDDLKKTYEKTAHFGGIVKVLDRKSDFRYYLNNVGLGKWWQQGKKYNVILMPNNVSVPDNAYLVAEYAKEKNANEESLHIFAFASSEWDKEQIESFTQKKSEHKYPCTFHIISEVDLLIRQMLGKHPPFKCPRLKFNEFGVANRNFNVMILGFGTMGQKALLRLIMNGQFVTNEGSRMRAIVADREVKHIKEQFLHSYPSLELCCDIEFKDFDVRDEEFFELLKGCKDVDYIVVALNSNEENKQVARNIRLYYERKGAKPFPFIAVSEKNEGVHKASHDEETFLFGCKEEIYKDAIIIRDETNRMAKAVHIVYGGDPQWQKLEWFFQESNRTTADFIPAMLGLANLEKDDAMQKETLTEDSKVAEVLAQTEKLRWNAFHAAMGYRPISIDEMHQRFATYSGDRNTRIHLDFCRRDTKARLHVCLVSWDELDEVTMAYRELAQAVGDKKEQGRDFKDNDRYIVKSIPKFLSIADDMQRQKR